ncbi:peptidase family C50, putative [Plasmodium chabaudi adami]|uniref:separase n=1 Tax=Plasmodium chabaudi adami TaxID=5826 RepID=A0A1C6YNK4_PLACE|nr:peptidase family C50, putative [Plasmodium chabaudi adami]
MIKEELNLHGRLEKLISHVLKNIDNEPYKFGDNVNKNVYAPFYEIYGKESHIEKLSYNAILEKHKDKKNIHKYLFYMFEYVHNKINISHNIKYVNFLYLILRYITYFWMFLSNNDKLALVFYYHFKLAELLFNLKILKFSYFLNIYGIQIFFNIKAKLNIQFLTKDISEETASSLIKVVISNLNKIILSENKNIINIFEKSNFIKSTKTSVISNIGNNKEINNNDGSKINKITQGDDSSNMQPDSSLYNYIWISYFDESDKNILNENHYNTHDIEKNGKMSNNKKAYSLILKHDNIKNKFNNILGSNALSINSAYNIFLNFVQLFFKITFYDIDTFLPCLNIFNLDNFLIYFHIYEILSYLEILEKKNTANEVLKGTQIVPEKSDKDVGNAYNCLGPKLVGEDIKDNLVNDCIFLNVNKNTKKILWSIMFDELRKAFCSNAKNVNYTLKIFKLTFSFFLFDDNYTLKYASSIDLSEEFVKKKEYNFTFISQIYFKEVLNFAISFINSLRYSKSIAYEVVYKSISYVFYMVSKLICNSNNDKKKYILVNNESNLSLIYLISCVYKYYKKLYIDKNELENGGENNTNKGAMNKSGNHGIVINKESMDKKNMNKKEYTNIDHKNKLKYSFVLLEKVYQKIQECLYISLTIDEFVQEQTKNNIPSIDENIRKDSKYIFPGDYINVCNLYACFIIKLNKINMFYSNLDIIKILMEKDKNIYRKYIYTINKNNENFIRFFSFLLNIHYEENQNDLVLKKYIANLKGPKKYKSKKLIKIMKPYHSPLKYIILKDEIHEDEEKKKKHKNEKIKNRKRSCNEEGYISKCEQNQSRFNTSIKSEITLKNVSNKHNYRSSLFQNNEDDLYKENRPFTDKFERDKNDLFRKCSYKTNRGDTYSDSNNSDDNKKTSSESSSDASILNENIYSSENFDNMEENVKYKSDMLLLENSLFRIDKNILKKINIDFLNVCHSIILSVKRCIIISDSIYDYFKKYEEYDPTFNIYICKNIFSNFLKVNFLNISIFSYVCVKFGYDDILKQMCNSSLIFMSYSIFEKYINFVLNQDVEKLKKHKNILHFSTNKLRKTEKNSIVKGKGVDNKSTDNSDGTKTPSSATSSIYSHLYLEDIYEILKDRDNCSCEDMFLSDKDEFTETLYLNALLFVINVISIWEMYLEIPIEVLNKMKYTFFELFYNTTIKIIQFIKKRNGYYFILNILKFVYFKFISLPFNPINTYTSIKLYDFYEFIINENSPPIQNIDNHPFDDEKININSVSPMKFLKNTSNYESKDEFTSNVRDNKQFSIRKTICPSNLYTDEINKNKYDITNFNNLSVSNKKKRISMGGLVPVFLNNEDSETEKEKEKKKKRKTNNDYLFYNSNLDKEPEKLSITPSKINVLFNNNENLFTSVNKNDQQNYYENYNEILPRRSNYKNDKNANEQFSFIDDSIIHVTPRNDFSNYADEDKEDQACNNINNEKNSTSIYRNTYLNNYYIPHIDLLFIILDMIIYYYFDKRKYKKIILIVNNLFNNIIRKCDYNTKEYLRSSISYIYNYYQQMNICNNKINPHCCMVIKHLLSIYTKAKICLLNKKIKKHLSYVKEKSTDDESMKLNYNEFYINFINHNYWKYIFYFDNISKGDYNFYNNEQSDNKTNTHTHAKMAMVNNLLSIHINTLLFAILYDNLSKYVTHNFIFFFKFLTFFYNKVCIDILNLIKSSHNLEFFNIYNFENNITYPNQNEHILNKLRSYLYKDIDVMSGSNVDTTPSKIQDIDKTIEKNDRKKNKHIILMDIDELLITYVHINFIFSRYCCYVMFFKNIYAQKYEIIFKRNATNDYFTKFKNNRDFFDFFEFKGHEKGNDKKCVNKYEDSKYSYEINEKTKPTPSIKFNNNSKSDAIAYFHDTFLNENEGISNSDNTNDSKSTSISVEYKNVSKDLDYVFLEFILEIIGCIDIYDIYKKILNNCYYVIKAEIFYNYIYNNIESLKRFSYLNNVYHLYKLYYYIFVWPNSGKIHNNNPICKNSDGTFSVETNGMRRKQNNKRHQIKENNDIFYIFDLNNVLREKFSKKYIKLMNENDSNLDCTTDHEWSSDNTSLVDENKDGGKYKKILDNSETSRNLSKAINKDENFDDEKDYFLCSIYNFKLKLYHPNYNEMEKYAGNIKKDDIFSTLLIINKNYLLSLKKIYTKINKYVYNYILSLYYIILYFYFDDHIIIKKKLSIYYIINMFQKKYKLFYSKLFDRESDLPLFNQTAHTPNYPSSSSGSSFFNSSSDSSASESINQSPHSYDNVLDDREIKPNEKKSDSEMLFKLFKVKDLKKNIYLIFEIFNNIYDEYYGDIYNNSNIANHIVTKIDIEIIAYFGEIYQITYMYKMHKYCIHLLLLCIIFTSKIWLVYIFSEKNAYNQFDKDGNDYKKYFGLYYHDQDEEKRKINSNENNINMKKRKSKYDRNSIINMHIDNTNTKDKKNENALTNKRIYLLDIVYKKITENLNDNNIKEIYNNLHNYMQQLIMCTSLFYITFICFENLYKNKWNLFFLNSANILYLYYVDFSEYVKSFCKKYCADQMHVSNLFIDNFHLDLINLKFEAYTKSNSYKTMLKRRNEKKIQDLGLNSKYTDTTNGKYSKESNTTMKYHNKDMSQLYDDKFNDQGNESRCIYTQNEQDKMRNNMMAWYHENETENKYNNNLDKKNRNCEGDDNRYSKYLFLDYYDKNGIKGCIKSLKIIEQKYQDNLMEFVQNNICLYFNIIKYLYKKKKKYLSLPIYSNSHIISIISMMKFSMVNYFTMFNVSCTFMSLTFERPVYEFDGESIDKFKDVKKKKKKNDSKKNNNNNSSCNILKSMKKLYCNMFLNKDIFSKIKFINTYYKKLSKILYKINNFFLSYDYLKKGVLFVCSLIYYPEIIHNYYLLSNVILISGKERIELLTQEEMFFENLNNDLTIYGKNNNINQDIESGYDENEREITNIEDLKTYEDQDFYNINYNKTPINTYLTKKNVYEYKNLLTRFFDYLKFLLKNPDHMNIFSIKYKREIIHIYSLFVFKKRQANHYIGSTKKLSKTRKNDYVSEKSGDNFNIIDKDESNNEKLGKKAPTHSEKTKENQEDKQIGNTEKLNNTYTDNNYNVKGNNFDENILKCFNNCKDKKKEKRTFFNFFWENLFLMNNNDTDLFNTLIEEDNIEHIVSAYAVKDINKLKIKNIEKGCVYFNNNFGKNGPQRTVSNNKGHNDKMRQVDNAKPRKYEETDKKGEDDFYYFSDFIASDRSFKLNDISVLNYLYLNYEFDKNITYLSNYINNRLFTYKCKRMNSYFIKILLYYINLIFLKIKNIFCDDCIYTIKKQQSLNSSANDCSYNVFFFLFLNIINRFNLPKEKLSSIFNNYFPGNTHCGMYANILQKIENEHSEHISSKYGDATKDEDTYLDRKILNNKINIEKNDKRKYTKSNENSKYHNNFNKEMFLKLVDIFLYPEKRCSYFEILTVCYQFLINMKDPKNKIHRKRYKGKMYHLLKIIIESKAKIKKTFLCKSMEKENNNFENSGFDNRSINEIDNTNDNSIFHLQTALIYLSLALYNTYKKSFTHEMRKVAQFFLDFVFFFIENIKNSLIILQIIESYYKDYTYAENSKNNNDDDVKKTKQNNINTFDNDYYNSDTKMIIFMVKFYFRKLLSLLYLYTDELISYTIKHNIDHEISAKEYFRKTHPFYLSIDYICNYNDSINSKELSECCIYWDYAIITMSHDKCDLYIARYLKSFLLLLSHIVKKSAECENTNEENILLDHKYTNINNFPTTINDEYNANILNTKDSIYYFNNAIDNLFNTYNNIESFENDIWNDKNIIYEDRDTIVSLVGTAHWYLRQSKREREFREKNKITQASTNPDKTASILCAKVNVENENFHKNGNDDAEKTGIKTKQNKIKNNNISNDTYMEKNKYKNNINIFFNFDQFYSISNEYNTDSCSNDKYKRNFHNKTNIDQSSCDMKNKVIKENQKITNKLFQFYYTFREANKCINIKKNEYVHVDKIHLNIEKYTFDEKWNYIKKLEKLLKQYQHMIKILCEILYVTKNINKDIINLKMFIDLWWNNRYTLEQHLKLLNLDISNTLGFSIHKLMSTPLISINIKRNIALQSSCNFNSDINTSQLTETNEGSNFKLHNDESYNNISLVNNQKYYLKTNFDIFVILYYYAHILNIISWINKWNSFFLPFKYWDNVNIINVIINLTIFSILMKSSNVHISKVKQKYISGNSRIKKSKNSSNIKGEDSNGDEKFGKEKNIRDTMLDSKIKNDEENSDDNNNITIDVDTTQIEKKVITSYLPLTNKDIESVLSNDPRKQRRKTSNDTTNHEYHNKTKGGEHILMQNLKNYLPPGEYDPIKSDFIQNMIEQSDMFKKYNDFKQFSNTSEDEKNDKTHTDLPHFNKDAKKGRRKTTNINNTNDDEIKKQFLNIYSIIDEEQKKLQKMSSKIYEQLKKNGNSKFGMVTNKKENDKLLKTLKRMTVCANINLNCNDSDKEDDLGGVKDNTFYLNYLDLQKKCEKGLIHCSFLKLRMYLYNILNVVFETNNTNPNDIFNIFNKITHSFIVDVIKCDMHKDKNDNDNFIYSKTVDQKMIRKNPIIIYLHNNLNRIPFENLQPLKDSYIVRGVQKNVTSYLYDRLLRQINENEFKKREQNNYSISHLNISTEGYANCDNDKNEESDEKVESSASSNKNKYDNNQFGKGCTTRKCPKKRETVNTCQNEQAGKSIHKASKYLSYLNGTSKETNNIDYKYDKLKDNLKNEEHIFNEQFMKKTRHFVFNYDTPNKQYGKTNGGKNFSEYFDDIKMPYANKDYINSEHEQTKSDDKHIKITKTIQDSKNKYNFIVTNYEKEEGQQNGNKNISYYNSKKDITKNEKGKRSRKSISIESSFLNPFNDKNNPNTLQMLKKKTEIPTTAHNELSSNSLILNDRQKLSRNSLKYIDDTNNITKKGDSYKTKSRSQSILRSESSSSNSSIELIQNENELQKIFRNVRKSMNFHNVMSSFKQKNDEYNFLIPQKKRKSVSESEAYYDKDNFFGKLLNKSTNKTKRNKRRSYSSEREIVPKVEKTPYIKYVPYYIKSDRFIDPKRSNIFYVIDPNGDLKRAQNATYPFIYFRNQKKYKHKNWNGYSGTFPSEKVILKNLCTNDLYIYCGHQGGEQYISKNDIQSSIQINDKEYIEEENRGPRKSQKSEIPQISKDSENNENTLTRYEKEKMYIEQKMNNLMADSTDKKRRRNSCKVSLKPSSTKTGTMKRKTVANFNEIYDITDLKKISTQNMQDSDLNKSGEIDIEDENDDKNIIQRTQNGIKCCVFLIGCSSGLVSSHGCDLDAWGTPYDYVIGGCIFIFGNLWNITDGEVDGFTQNFFWKWTQPNSSSLFYSNYDYNKLKMTNTREISFNTFTRMLKKLIKAKDEQIIDQEYKDNSSIMVDDNFITMDLDIYNYIKENDFFYKYFQKFYSHPIILNQNLLSINQNKKYTWLSITEALVEAKQYCRLPNTTGSAVVIYGIPL